MFKIIDHDDFTGSFTLTWYECENCHEMVSVLNKKPMDYKFCPYCGKNQEVLDVDKSLKKEKFEFVDRQNAIQVIRKIFKEKAVTNEKYGSKEIDIEYEGKKYIFEPHQVRINGDFQPYDSIGWYMFEHLINDVLGSIE